MRIQNQIPAITFGLAILLLILLIGLLFAIPQSGEGFSSSEFSNDGIIVLGDSTGSKLSTLSIYDLAYPPGTILLWNDSNAESASAPTGWALCNGDNGTPDMSNRFPLGWDINNTDRPITGTKSVGGAETVPLTENQIPEHTHKLKLHEKVTENRCDREFSRRAPPDIWDWNNAAATSADGGKEDGTVEPHPNMPPFRVMKFIMKL